jgi:hypothetical protein
MDSTANPAVTASFDGNLAKSVSRRMLAALQKKGKWSRGSDLNR